MDTFTFIIKPTSGCNAHCLYCSSFSAPDDSKTLMDDALLEKLFHVAAQLDCERIVMLWHGNEPLLAGIDFYKKVFQFTCTYSNTINFNHLFQSNLTLISPEYISVLKLLCPEKTISSSVDPFSDLRSLPNSDYTSVWLDSYFLLKENGFRVNIVYVVHSDVLDKAEDLYFYFKNLGVSGIRFNPLYKSGRAGISFFPERFHITPVEWGNFLLSLYKVWNEDGRVFNLYPLAEWYNLLLGRDTLSCAFSYDCSNDQMGVDWMGRIYICGRIMDRQLFLLGNINQDSASNVLKRLRGLRLIKRRDELKKGICSDCRYFGFCKGGCPDDAETIYYKSKWCEGYKMILEKMCFDFKEKNDTELSCHKNT